MQGHKVGGESARYLRFLFSLDDKGVLFYSQKKKTKTKAKQNLALLLTMYSIESMYLEELCHFSGS